MAKHSNPSSLDSMLGDRQKRYGGPHLFVFARAGTGKTTLMCNAVKRLWRLNDPLTPSNEQEAIYDALCQGDRPRTIRYMAFSKKLEVEVRPKMPDKVMVKNFHSTGYQILRDYYGRDALKVDEWCARTRAAQVLHLDPRKKKAKNYWMIRATTELVHWMKLNLIPFGEDDWHSEPEVVVRILDEIVEAHDVAILDNTLRSELYVAALRTLDLCRTMPEGVIDFDDMLYLPIINHLPIDPVDLGMVDEAQDMTPVTQALAKRLARRLMVVGDERQTIYQFAGSRTEGLEHFREELSHERQQGCQTYPLTVTYRCPHQIVEIARQWVPDYQAHTTNRPGAVVQYLDTEQLSVHVRRMQLSPSERHQRMLVLARTNYILVQEFLDWMRDGVLCKISSMSLETMMEECIAQYTPEGQSSVTAGQLLQHLDTARRQMHTELYASLTPPSSDTEDEGNEQDRRRDELLERIAREDTRFDVLEGLLQQVSQQARSDEILRSVAETERNAQVEFSTIHKAKGTEREHVVLLDEPPVKIRRELSEAARRQQQVALENLLYVAVTRSQNTLYLHEQDERIEIPPEVNPYTLQ